MHSKQKKIHLFLFFIFTAKALAQVGIGTEKPEAKLHVVQQIDTKNTQTTDELSDSVLRIDGDNGYSLLIGNKKESPYSSYISSINTQTKQPAILSLNPFGGNICIGSNFDFLDNITILVGDTKIRNIPTANNQNKNWTILTPSTSYLSRVESSSGSNYGIFSQTFTLKNVVEDLVTNFNTNIPTSRYNVSIIGFSMSDLSGLYTPQDSNIFQPLNIMAFEQDGTWRLAADYPGAQPFSSRQSTWNITILITNKTLVKTFPTITINMNEQDTIDIVKDPFNF